MERSQTPARLYGVFLALAAMLAGSAVLVAAQGGRVTRAGVRSLGQIVSAEKPLVGAHAPAVDLRRIDPNDPNQKKSIVPNAAGNGVHPLAGGANGPKPVPAPPPYFDLTTVPRPPQVGNSTLS